MNRKNLFALVALTMAFISSVFVSCKRDNKVTPYNNTATVSMYLTDAPADYDALYIDIQKVEVTMEGSAAVEIAPVRPGVYDILKLRNNLDTLLVRADLPAGKISQIRLILGANNSVVVDGKTYALNTPSAQESGLKLNLHQELVAGGSYKMWLDFDAASSVVVQGNGEYKLKPTVKAFSEATDGRIKGYVLPGTALVTVYASNGTETYAAIPDVDGFFVFKGMPEGTYTLTYDAAVLTFTDITVKDVKVTYGLTTDVGTTIMK